MMIPSPDEIRNLKRKELFVLCKEAGIPLHGTNKNLAEQLITYYSNEKTTENTDTENFNGNRYCDEEHSKPETKLHESDSGQSSPRQFKPFDSFSRLFSERATPLKSMKFINAENTVTPIKLFQKLSLDESPSSKKPETKVKLVDRHVQTDQQDAEEGKPTMDSLFDQLISAFDSQSLPLETSKSQAKFITSTCVVTGERECCPVESWGQLVLRRGRIYLRYQKTEREFLFHPNELAQIPDRDEEYDNLVSPTAIAEHDQRWLMREIEQMKISRQESPRKSLSPSRLRTPNKLNGNPMLKQAISNSTVYKENNVKPGAFSFAGYKDPTIVEFQPKNKLLHTPKVFK